MTSLDRRVPERFVLLDGCFNFRDLDPGLAAGLLSQAKLAITVGYRGLDGQALFGPAREAPAAAGPATSSPPSSAARCVNRVR